jgi:hypothetical protein
MGSSPQTIRVNARGVEGHIKLTKDALPERSDFTVLGSRGVIDARLRQQNLMTFGTLIAQLQPLLQAQGVTSDFLEMLKTLGQEMGILNVDRYVKPGAANPTGGAAGQVQGGPGAQGVDPAALEQLAAGQV